MVEGTGLENRQAGDRLVGSNPTPSATCPRESVLPIWLRPYFSVVFEVYTGQAANRHQCWEAQKHSLKADILRTC